MTNNKVIKAEIKKSGQNWGKPTKFEKAKGARRLRKKTKKDLRETIEKR